jgi:hypothetical protein
MAAIDDLAEKIKNLAKQKGEELSDEQAVEDSHRLTVKIGAVPVVLALPMLDLQSICMQAGIIICIQRFVGY